MDDSERIWYQDPSGFFRDDRLAHFVPQQHTTLAQQLNAVLRFALYFGVISFIFQRSWFSLCVPLITAAVTYLVYASDIASKRPQEALMERLDVSLDSRDRGRTTTVCTRPTLDNPFMNVLISDYTKLPQRPGACDITHRRVNELADDLASHNVYKDADDIFDRSTNSRQFYTVPGSTIPNDQGAFANWLYATGPSCKERNGAQCNQNLYRQLLP